MSDLIIDPVLKSLIPPLSEEEFKQLEENIKNEGCRDALVIWQGTIVDGHNRYKICQQNGIAYKTEEKEFADRDEVAEWIIRNQFGRRNLSLAQRSELAMKLKPAIQKKAKENHAANGGDKKAARQKSNTPKIDTYDELAKIAGVSSDTIRKTEKILDKGTPEQIERARKGGKGNSVNAIYNEVTGKTKPTKAKGSTTEPVTKQAAVEIKQDNPLDKVEAEESSESIKRIASDSLQAELAGIKLKREPLTKEEKNLMSKIVDDMRNPGQVMESTIDDVLEELKCSMEMYLNELEVTLQSRIKFLRSKENNEKIMAVLSEAVTTINEWKGKYSYERL